MVIRLFPWNAFTAAGLVEAAIQRDCGFEVKLSRFADFEHEFVERCGVVVAAREFGGRAKHGVIVVGIVVGAAICDCAGR